MINNLDIVGIIGGVGTIMAGLFNYLRGRNNDKQEASTKTLQQIIDSYKGQIQAMQEANDKNNVATQAQIKDLQKDNKYIREELKKIQTENDEVRKQYSALNALYESAKSENDNLKAENKHLTFTVATYQTKFGTLEE